MIQPILSMYISPKLSILVKKNGHQSKMLAKSKMAEIQDSHHSKKIDKGSHWVLYNQRHKKPNFVFPIVTH